MSSLVAFTVTHGNQQCLPIPLKPHTGPLPVDTQLLGNTQTNTYTAFERPKKRWRSSAIGWNDSSYTALGPVPGQSNCPWHCVSADLCTYLWVYSSERFSVGRTHGKVGGIHLHWISTKWFIFPWRTQMRDAGINPSTQPSLCPVALCWWSTLHAEKRDKMIMRVCPF